MGWIDKHINDVEYIYFAGGEPLIMDEHWYILDKLHNLGRHNVKLKYNTNMSKLQHLGKNAVDYWKHWDRPYISVEGSIDETGKRAEWIRSGTVWKNVQSNIQTLVSENIKCQPNVSIGCYNVIRLPELIEELYELYYNPNNKTLKVNLNAVLNDWCKISVLPDDWKKEIINDLQKFESKTKIPITQLNKIYVELSKPQDVQDTYQFFRRASFLDLNKRSTLLESIPQLSRLNDSYGNLYEKLRDEWIEKSIDKGTSSVNTNVRRSVCYG